MACSLGSLTWSIHGTGAWSSRITTRPAGAGTTRAGPVGVGSDPKGRELLLQLRGFARRASRRHRALHQRLEPVVAFLAEIFEDGHDVLLCSETIIDSRAAGSQQRAARRPACFTKTRRSTSGSAWRRRFRMTMTATRTTT